MLEDETSAKLVDPFENVLSYSSSYWKLRHILQIDFFQRTFRLLNFFSVFPYFSELVLINECVNGNQQHCVINTVRNYHDEVEKAVADFHASRLK